MSVWIWLEGPIRSGDERGTCDARYSGDATGCALERRSYDSRGGRIECAETGRGVLWCLLGIPGILGGRADWGLRDGGDGMLGRIARFGFGISSQGSDALFKVGQLGIGNVCIRGRWISRLYAHELLVVATDVGWFRRIFAAVVRCSDRRAYIAHRFRRSRVARCPHNDDPFAIWKSRRGMAPWNFGAGHHRGVGSASGRVPAAYKERIRGDAKKQRTRSGHWKKMNRFS